MTEKIIINASQKGFPKSNKLTKNGIEFWTARKLFRTK